MGFFYHEVLSRIVKSLQLAATLVEFYNKTFLKLKTFCVVLALTFMQKLHLLI